MGLGTEAAEQLLTLPALSVGAERCKQALIGFRLHRLTFTQMVDECLAVGVNSYSQVFHVDKIRVAEIALNAARERKAEADELDSLVRSVSYWKDAYAGWKFWDGFERAWRMMKESEAIS